MVSRVGTLEGMVIYLNDKQFPSRAFSVRLAADLHSVVAAAPFIRAHMQPSDQIIDGLVALHNNTSERPIYRQALIELCKLARAEMALAVTLDQLQVRRAMSDD